MGDHSQCIRILQLESNTLEAELVRFELDREPMPFDIRCAADQAEYQRLLVNFLPHVVLCGWQMLGIAGREALVKLRERDEYLPFVFVGPSLGERELRELFEAGATDYVPQHTPSLLGPAVLRAWREAEGRLVRERLEKELLRAQRFESLALLAGGLSHDLRNLLQPLLLASQSLQDHYPDDPRLMKLAELIGDCSRRSIDMLQAMLDFGRGVERTQRLEPERLFAMVELLWQATPTRSLRLEQVCLTPDLVFEGNLTELQQCLFNLCLNAIHAMDETGLLRLQAEQVELPAEFFLPQETPRPGAYLRLMVSDTGMGMSREVLARLFEPFFTTKVDGTGLGLLSCRRVVAGHGGVIRIDSKLGVGTTFYLYFPLPTAALDADERRLLVVGEAGIGLPHLLAGDYGAEIVADGEAALAWYRKHRAPELVLIDGDLQLADGEFVLPALYRQGYRGAAILLTAAGGSLGDSALPALSWVQRLSKPASLPLVLQTVQTMLAEIALERKPKPTPSD